MANNIDNELRENALKQLAKLNPKFNPAKLTKVEHKTRALDPVLLDMVQDVLGPIADDLTNYLSQDGGGVYCYSLAIPSDLAKAVVLPVKRWLDDHAPLGSDLLQWRVWYSGKDDSVEIALSRRNKKRVVADN